jgi:8-oxo-dGTP diphosphatase
MIKYNLLFILNSTEDKILMCKRQSNPYKGKYNLCGGKVEPLESPLQSAYRELFEETGISKNDILLKPFMDFVWHVADTIMYVYIGKLNKDVILKSEKHPLKWIDVRDNFFNTEQYAGEGNIGHMYAIYRYYKETIFNE